MFTNSEYGRMLFTKGEKVSDEENEKYVIDDEVVVEKRGDKNNSKMTSSTKSINTYKIETDTIQKKINKRKIIKETIKNNGNVWENDGKRTTCERGNNTGYIEEKDSSQSSNKSCRI